MRARLLKRCRESAYNWYGCFFWDNLYYVGPRWALSQMQKDLKRGNSYCLEQIYTYYEEYSALECLRLSRREFIMRVVNRERERIRRRALLKNARDVNRRLQMK